MPARPKAATTHDMEPTLIAKHLRSLWEAGELTDTQVVVAGEEVAVHRVRICCRACEAVPSVV